MKKLDLTDLIPEQATFTLSGTGDVVHTLRPVSLVDGVWITRNLGGPAEIQQMFERQEYEKACRLVFHLLEDKTPFQAVEVPVWNEETGEPKGTEKLGGYRAVMAAVSGARDQVALWKAIFQTVGISQPKLDELQAADAVESEKKSPAPRAKSTGKKSSTLSKRNTDTRTAKSAR